MTTILIILAIVQGIAEFLPISSSGHLAIVSNFFPALESEQLLYFLVLHTGTACATLIFFRKDIYAIIKGFLRYPFDKDSVHWLLLIVVISIPTGIVGIMFKDSVVHLSHSLLAVGIFLCITAGFLTTTMFFNKGEKDLHDFGWKQALLVGMAQSFALLPGISRSGSTIVMAVILGANPTFAGKLSFLAAFVPIFGATLLEVISYSKHGGSEISMTLLGMGFSISFVVGLLSLGLLMNILKNRKLYYFAIYCTLVGVSLIVYSIFGSN